MFFQRINNKLPFLYLKIRNQLKKILINIAVYLKDVVCCIL